ncbi:MAG: hypothetical protein CMB22_03250 [Euryarchaeota archaeon]|nr:hypothetical protein [Euryarchaeota archaeon]|tara:strand:+ start:35706 stop:36206 length:501 start_codon:yes stop_codon:yes gene_type:complete
MEWSVGENQEIYSVVLSNDGEAMSLSSLTKDGNEMVAPNLQISSDDFPGRIVVVTEGTPKFAHVARVGDDWWIHLDGRVHVVRGHEKGGQKGQDSDSGLTAPMPGTILEVLVKEGQRVREGQTLMVMEAMKMEHKIQAPGGGEVSLIHFREGERVDMGSVLIELAD